jgi:two-component system sensor histidine kinase/response regulator
LPEAVPARGLTTSLGRILVADEDPRDLRALATLLDGGYATARAHSGEHVLSLLSGSEESGEEVLHDVLILDAALPGVSAFHVCRQIRAWPSTRFLPVLVVTDLSSPEERAEALRAGADEVLCRPIDASELRIRVRSLFRFRRLREERELAWRKLLSQALPQGESVGSTTVALASDLRGPLLRIMASAQALESSLPPEVQQIDHHAGRILAAARLVQRHLTDLVDVSRLEEGRRPLNVERFNLRAAALLTLDEFRDQAEVCRVALELEPSQADPDLPAPLVEADAGLVLRLMEALLGDALRRTPPGGTLRLVVGRPRDGRVEVHVAVTCGMTECPEAESRRDARDPDRCVLRERFDAGSGGDALGRELCRLALQAHGGRLWTERPASCGRVQGFVIPVEQKRG